MERMNQINGKSEKADEIKATDWKEDGSRMREENTNQSSNRKRKEIEKRRNKQNY